MTTTLAGKIAKASIEVGAFRPDKTNSEQRYSYISADQVLSRGGDALAKQGVMIVPFIESVTFAQVERKDKNPRIDATVAYSMLISDDESELSVPWVGYGSDYMTPDKAAYKAITSGHKYFLMKLLNIGVGNEDSEHETQREAEDATNPDPVSDVLWTRWGNLIKRADALKIQHGNPDRAKVTSAELTAAGLELSGYVSEAEAQAKAAAEPQA